MQRLKKKKKLTFSKGKTWWGLGGGNGNKLGV